MGNGIYIALSGAKAQTTAMDVVSNNVANANTVAFRAERMSFGQALGKAQSPDAAYAQVRGGGTDTRAGAIQQTGNPLDLALVGDGHFAVKTPRGVRYTRAGNFRIGPQGTLVTSGGLEALGRTGEPIRVPADAKSVQIGADGTVSAGEDVIGQLRISKLDASTVKREGAGLFAGNAAVADAEGVKIVPGALEKSNVNVVRGMVDLVRVSRGYESMLRMIESYRQIDSRTARQLGTPK